MSVTESNDIKNLKDVLSKGEYEAQFFDYSAFSLIENITELTISCQQQIIRHMETYLIKKCENPDDHEKLKEKIRHLREKYEISTVNHFKEAKSKIHDIFNIPSNILLPEDRVQIDQYSEEDINNINNEIEELTSRYRRAICMESLLKKEKKMFPELNLLEKKAVKLEDDINTLSDLFQYNKESMTTLNEDLKNLSYLFNQIVSLPVKEPPTYDNKWMSEKLFS